MTPCPDLDKPVLFATPPLNAKPFKAIMTSVPLPPGFSDLAILLDSC